MPSILDPANRPFPVVAPPTRPRPRASHGLVRHLRHRPRPPASLDVAPVPSPSRAAVALARYTCSVIPVSLAATRALGRRFSVRVGRPRHPAAGLGLRAHQHPLRRRPFAHRHQGQPPSCGGGADAEGFSGRSRAPSPRTSLDWEAEVSATGQEPDVKTPPPRDEPMRYLVTYFLGFVNAPGRGFHGHIWLR